MNKALLITCLPAFIGFASCSKDPAPVANTGSYNNDRQPKTCQASVATTTTPSGRVYLDIQLATVPQPASGPEVLNVEFMKEAGQPASTYKVTAVHLSNNGMVSLVFPSATGTLTEVGTTVSGTFTAGGFFPNSPGITLGITDGIFTNVQL